MVNPTAASLSALRALGTKMAVTSHNVANIETEGFKKSRTILEEATPTGVTARIESVDTPGAILPVDNQTGETRETSNVDLAEEMVGMMITERAYGANLATMKTWDKMIESVLDLFA